MSTTNQTTQQNNSSLLNNFFDQDFYMPFEEHAMPQLNDDIINQEKPRDDAQWALVDQDELIRQTQGGLFDLEKEYRSIERLAESMDKPEDGEKFQAPSEAAAWEYMQPVASQTTEIQNGAEDFGYPSKNNIILKDNQSVADEKSLETTHTNMLSDEEGSVASQPSSSFNIDQTCMGSLNLSQKFSTFTTRSEASRRVSLEFEETSSVYKFETTFSRRGRKSDDQLRQLMNIYIENGGRMTKHMLQEAAKQSGLKRLQVYKWYWDLERKKSQDMKTQKTMYPSLIFRVTKFGKDITQPIRKPLFKVERNARRFDEESACNNTTQSQSPQ